MSGNIQTMVTGNNYVTVDGKNNKAVIDGKEFPFVKGMKGNCMVTLDNKSYVDGFEIVNGKWKRTLKAFFICFFS